MTKSEWGTGTPSAIGGVAAFRFSRQGCPCGLKVLATRKQAQRRLVLRKIPGKPAALPPITPPPGRRSLVAQEEIAPAAAVRAPAAATRRPGATRHPSARRSRTPSHPRRLRSSRPLRPRRASRRTRRMRRSRPAVGPATVITPLGTVLDARRCRLAGAQSLRGVYVGAGAGARHRRRVRHGRPHGLPVRGTPGRRCCGAGDSGPCRARARETGPPAARCGAAHRRNRLAHRTSPWTARVVDTSATGGRPRARQGGDCRGARGCKRPACRGGTRGQRSVPDPGHSAQRAGRRPARQGGPAGHPGRPASSFVSALKAAR